MITKKNKKEISFNVIIENSKYEYRFYTDGTACVLHYGKHCRDVTHDPFIFELAYELYKYQSKNN